MVYFLTCSYFRISNSVLCTLYSVLCSTLKGFIGINFRKKSMIYTQSTHSISSTTSNDNAVPRLSYKRVSMGLTDRRKTAKNLVDSRKNWKNLTVNRKEGKKSLRVNRKRNCSLDLLTLRKVLNSPMVAFFISRYGYFDSVKAKRLLGVDLDLGSFSAVLSGN